MIRISKYIRGQMNIILVFFLQCFLCVGQYWGISALNLLLVILIIGSAFFAKLDDLFVIMYATLPLYNLVSYKVGTYSLHYLIVGIFIVKYFRYTKIRIYKLLVFLALFMLRIFAADFVLLVSWSLLILPLILTLDDPIWEDNVKRIVFWMNMGMILSCGAGYIMMITQKTIYTASYLYIAGARTVRFAGVSGDSVVFGEACALIISINLAYCFLNHAKKGFYIFSSVMLAVSSLLSYSKMTLICNLLILGIFLVLYGREHTVDRKRTLKIIICASAFVLMAFLLVLILLNYGENSAVVLGYIDRFTRDDLSTGRFTLWGAYLEMFGSKMKYLFFPLTSEELSTPMWNPSTGSYTAYVHNLYLETVAAFGWCASALIFIWILYRLYRFFSGRKKIILILPVFVLLFMGFGSHGNFEYQFYLQFALALAFLNPNMENALQHADVSERRERI